MPGPAGGASRLRLALLSAVGAGAAVALAVELVLLDATDRPFSASTPIALAAVATAVIGLLVAAVLSRKEETGRGHAERLQLIGDPTIDALDDEELLSTLAARLREALKADEVAVLLPAASAGLRVAAAAGLDAGYTTFVESGSFPATAPAGFSRPATVPSGWRPARTALIQPVIAEGTPCHGMVYVGWTESRLPHAEDERLVTLAAGRVWSVVHRRRLIEDERRARLGTEGAHRQLSVLAHGSRALATALKSYERELAALAEVCVPAFADLCRVELVNDEGKLDLVASHTDSGTGVVSSPGDGWQSLLEQVLVRGQPCFGFTAKQDNDELAGRLLQALQADSVVVVPVLAGGLSLGTITLATSAARRGFRPSDVAVVEGLAVRLGLAVQRVMLYGQLQASAAAQAQAAQRLRRLTEAAIELAAAADLEHALNDAAAETQRVMRSAAALVLHQPADQPEQWGASGRIDATTAGTLSVVAVAATRSGRPIKENGCLAAPLLDREQVCRGALAVVSRPDAPLDADDEAALVSLAHLVALVLGRAQLTTALAGREARLNAIVDASPVAILRLSPHGEVEEGNPAAQALFGWPAGDCTGPLPEAIAGNLLELAARAAAGAASGDAEVQGPGPDGEPLDLSVAAAPVRGGADQVEAVLLLVADVSERRRAQRQLELAQRLEAMGQVAGGVAHDFNNLLTIIVGYTEALLAATDADDPARPLLESIERAGASAAALTRQLLGLAGRRKPEPVAVALDELVAGIEPVVRRLMGVDVQVSVGASPVGTVMADPAELEQVILNLAINARDAMPAGGRLELSVREADLQPAEAEVRRLDPGVWVVLSVTDTGTGMDEETRARCFEPFFTLKERGRGTGLGLAGVYAVAHEAGGTVEVASQLGEGTTFRVWLPRSDQWPPAPVPVAQPVAPSAGGLILLVEDEEEIRELGRQTLEESGFTVVSAADGPSAIAAFEQQTAGFDVLVTDIVMPGMRGTELASRLLDAQPSLQVLYVSGYTGAGPQAGESINGVAVLRKPFRSVDLVTRVSRLVEVGPRRV